MDLYEAREEQFGEEVMRELERVVLLRIVDEKWMEHIDNMDRLREGMYLRSYGQRDPVVEYRIEGFDMFDDMIASIREDVSKLILTVHIRNEQELVREQVAKPIVASHGDETEEKKQPVKKDKKPGRNDPCSCGSGKKYKKCCGQEE
jgi:preprotein translocase subunit SecA